jgi:hypothetical protein
VSLIYIIKVLVQPGLGNNGRNLNHQTSSYLLIYKCEVAKLRSKAGNFLFGKRGGAKRGRERQKEREKDRDRESKT